jgi:anti-anti-sigma regulatory factor
MRSGASKRRNSSIACAGRPDAFGSPSWSGEMFRIRRSGNWEVVFSLSGRLDKENAAELQAVIGAEVSGQHIVLDLKDVTLVGQDGVTFLAECEGADITLANCPPYVREWIKRQRSGE